LLSGGKEVKSYTQKETEHDFVDLTFLGYQADEPNCPNPVFEVQRQDRVMCSTVNDKDRELVLGYRGLLTGDQELHNCECFDKKPGILLQSSHWLCGSSCHAQARSTPSATKFSLFVWS